MGQTNSTHIQEAIESITNVKGVDNIEQEDTKYRVIVSDDVSTAAVIEVVENIDKGEDYSVDTTATKELNQFFVSINA